MKPFIITMLLAISSLIAVSQDIKCVDIPLNTTEELTQAEPCILSYAEKILATTMAQNDITNEVGVLFLWMAKTDKYTFTFTSTISKLYKGGNDNLMSIYLAALTKSAIEGNTNYAEKGIVYFYDYIKNPENGVVLTSKVKKFIESVEAKDFEKYY